VGASDFCENAKCNYEIPSSVAFLNYLPWVVALFIILPLSCCDKLNGINLILYRSVLKSGEKQRKRENLFLLFIAEVSCLAEGDPDCQSPLPGWKCEESWRRQIERKGQVVGDCLPRSAWLQQGWLGPLLAGPWGRAVGLECPFRTRWVSQVLPPLGCAGVGKGGYPPG